MEEGEREGGRRRRRKEEEEEEEEEEVERHPGSCGGVSGLCGVEGSEMATAALCAVRENEYVEGGKYLEDPVLFFKTFVFS